MIVEPIIQSKRQRFDELNQTDKLHAQIEKYTQELTTCAGNIRKSNRIEREIESCRREIDRRTRKRRLFEVLASDVEDAIVIHKAAKRLRPTPPTLSSSNNVTQALNDDIKPEEVVTVFEDVMLIDDGERLQDAHAVVDDRCSNCGTLMERNMQLSYLVCPNINCQHMRWYMDSTVQTGNVYNTRMSSKSNKSGTGRCCTHYSSFLSLCQGKTNKKFDQKFMKELAYYCYVEGGRKPGDITKKMVNAAQKYMQGRMQYNQSITMKMKLRGEEIHIPPELIKKFQLLFKAMWPVFVEMKASIHPDRTNMVNFNFVSRLFCRLFGYDVFLPLFDELDLDKSELRLCAFMRELFKRMGWEWSDCMCKFSSDVLDEFARHEKIELSDDIQTTVDNNNNNAQDRNTNTNF